MQVKCSFKCMIILNYTQFSIYNYNYGKNESRLQLNLLT